mmetsp:Transcript_107892/g.186049  ORF Transcript_107892/g.186049 Transcript_107892/m.186049 type:complete len:357 (-) Transcript_107892:1046-2116(-)
MNPENNLRALTFEDSCCKVQVLLKELRDADYGLFMWPSALVLGHYIFKHRCSFVGRRVLEIGSGTSLPGIVAAKVGASVTLTDRDDEVVLKNIRTICQLNGLEHIVDVSPLTWGVFDDASMQLCGLPEPHTLQTGSMFDVDLHVQQQRELLKAYSTSAAKAATAGETPRVRAKKSNKRHQRSGPRVIAVERAGYQKPYCTNPVDYILGADCFYDKSDFDDLLATVHFLLQANEAPDYRPDSSTKTNPNTKFGVRPDSDPSTYPPRNCNPKAYSDPAPAPGLAPAAESLPTTVFTLPTHRPTFLCAYHNRDMHHHSLQRMLTKWGMVSEVLPLPSDPVINAWADCEHVTLYAIRLAM